MATIRKTPAHPPAVEEATEVDTIPADVDELQSVMADLAGSSSSKITVYRVVKNQPLAYVFACTPDAFSLDDLRDRYNGGEFRLFIAKDGALWKNRRVFVEPKQSALAGESAPTASAELAASMREGFARQAELLQTVARAAAQPSTPSFGGFDLPATISAIAAAIAALRPPPTPPAPPAVHADPNQSIDMLLKGIELARELKADAGGSDEPSLMTIMRELIRSPVLAQAVAAATPAAVPVRRPPTQPALVPPQSFARETPAPAPPEPVNMLTPYLDMLVRKAASGGDPALYADLVLDNVEEEAIHALLNRSPSALDALIADYAPVAQHREWFQSLIDIIVNALAEPDESPLPLNGLNSGDANASAHSTPVIPREHSTG